MFKQQRMMVGFIVLLFLFGTPVLAGTISNPHQYAWSNQAGYINFENVIVDDNSLSGYAWAANAGWIKFNPAQGGVTNDGAGNLSGFAWGANLGWIDFSNASIVPSTGMFSGTATGEVAGTITFDCSYCDVQTTWRSSTAVLTTPGGGGSVIYPITNPTIVPTPVAPAPTYTPITTSTISTQPATTSSQIVVTNAPLTLVPGQSGQLTQNTIAGKVIVTIPSTAVTKSATIKIVAERSATAEAFFLSHHQILLDGTVYQVTAKDANGESVTSFRTPVSVTLPVAKKYAGSKGLAVYAQSDESQRWSLVPDAIFQKTSVLFFVNHFTKFAIVKAEDVQAGSTSPPPSLSAPSAQQTPTTTQSEQPVRAHITKSSRSLIGVSLVLFTMIFLTLSVKKWRNRHHH